MIFSGCAQKILVLIEDVRNSNSSKICHYLLKSIFYFPKFFILTIYIFTLMWMGDILCMISWNHLFPKNLKIIRNIISVALSYAFQLRLCPDLYRYLIIFFYCVCWLVSCPKCNASRKISSFLKRLPTLYLLYHSYFPVHRFDKLPSYWLLINTINMVSHEENDIFFDIYLLICRKLDRHKNWFSISNLIRSQKL